MAQSAGRNAPASIPASTATGRRDGQATVARAAVDALLAARAAGVAARFGARDHGHADREAAFAAARRRGFEGREGREFRGARRHVARGQVQGDHAGAAFAAAVHVRQVEDGWGGGAEAALPFAVDDVRGVLRKHVGFGAHHRGRLGLRLCGEVEREELARRAGAAGVIVGVGKGVLWFGSCWRARNEGGGWTNGGGGAGLILWRWGLDGGDGHARGGLLAIA